MPQDMENREKLAATCPRCHKIYVNKRSYRNHIRSCTFGSYKCDLCQKTFSNEHHLTEHMSLVHTYYCNVCGCAFNSQELLRVHRMSHFPYECALCAERFANVSDMDGHKCRHLVAAAKPQAPVCRLCHTTFTSATVLRQHQAICRQILKCAMCEKQFGEHGYLNLHQMSPHEYGCDICRRRFTSKQEVDEHVHVNHYLHQCPKCLATFERRQHLDAHFCYFSNGPSPSRTC